MSEQSDIGDTSSGVATLETLRGPNYEFKYPADAKLETINEQNYSGYNVKSSQGEWLATIDSTRIPDRGAIHEELHQHELSEGPLSEYAIYNTENVERPNGLCRQTELRGNYGNQIGRKLFFDSMFQDGTLVLVLSSADGRQSRRRNEVELILNTLRVGSGRSAELALPLPKRLKGRWWAAGWSMAFWEDGRVVEESNIDRHGTFNANEKRIAFRWTVGGRTEREECAFKLLGNQLVLYRNGSAQRLRRDAIAQELGP